MCDQQDFGFDKQKVSIRGGRPVNALPTGRRRATKEATAYSKATVQPLLHAKHSNVLCKGWAGGEHREGLSHEGHLKHTQTKAGPALSDALWCPPISFLCECLRWKSMTNMHGLAESSYTCRVLSDDHDLNLMLHLSWLLPALIRFGKSPCRNYKVCWVHVSRHTNFFPTQQFQLKLWHIFFMRNLLPSFSFQ